MDYLVFSLSSGESESSAEAHVFTRAYRAAWRVKHGTEPTGAHQIAALDLVIHFSGSGPARARALHDGSVSRDAGPVPAAGYGVGSST